MTHFQNLQINIALPTFDIDKSNPLKFLEQLEKYFVRKNVLENQKLLLVEETLRGRAKIWVETRVAPFPNYDEFKKAFVKDMYGIEIKTKEKNDWVTRKYKTNDGSLYEYFIEQLKASKYFSPEMNKFEINYNIIRQLPTNVRKILSTIDYGDTDHFL